MTATFNEVLTTSQQTKLGEITSCKVGEKKSSLKVDLKWSFSRLVLISKINSTLTRLFPHSLTPKVGD